MLETKAKAILAENDPRRLLPELVREARQMRREREGNDPSRSARCGRRPGQCDWSGD